MNSDQSSGVFDRSESDSSSLYLLADIPMQITAEIGKRNMFVQEVLNLGTGSIVELDRAAGAPVDVLVNSKVVAKGEIVAVNENYGVRITELCTSVGGSKQPINSL